VTRKRVLEDHEKAPTATNSWGFLAFGHNSAVAAKARLEGAKKASGSQKMGFLQNHIKIDWQQPF
jgi:hypothetical protein